ncbi:MAG: hypothetical protein ACOZAM_22425 [Pseudomonadota bacterium]
MIVPAWLSSPNFRRALESRLGGEEFRRIVVLRDHEAGERILLETGKPLVFLPFAGRDEILDDGAYGPGRANADRQLAVENERRARGRRRQSADLAQHIGPEIGNEGRFIDAVDATGIGFRIEIGISQHRPLLCRL